MQPLCVHCLDSTASFFDSPDEKQRAGIFTRARTTVFKDQLAYAVAVTVLEAVEEAGMKKNPVWLMCVALSLLWTPKPASAQTPGQLTPCGIATIGDPRFTAQGLIPVVGGLVFDSNQGLCWLADSNLAGSPE